jgi:hypothetical protein
VAADLEYEIRYFAGKYDLSQEYVRDLIARVGNDRDELDRAAKESERPRQRFRLEAV